MQQRERDWFGSVNFPIKGGGLRKSEDIYLFWKVRFQVVRRARKRELFLVFGFIVERQMVESLEKKKKMEGKKSRIGSSTNQVGSILRYDCHGFTIHLHSHIILHFLLLFLGVVSLVQVQISSYMHVFNWVLGCPWIWILLIHLLFICVIGLC